MFATQCLGQTHKSLEMHGCGSLTLILHVKDHSQRKQNIITRLIFVRVRMFTSLTEAYCKILCQTNSAGTMEPHMNIIITQESRRF